MALCIAITRDGQPRKMVYGYGWWHMERATDAAKAHVPAVKDEPMLTVWSHPDLSGGLTITYPMGFKDPTDGEEFILEAGDVVHVWRDR